MQNKADIAAKVESLEITPSARHELATFVSSIVDIYPGTLLSITAFGSAVSGDYEEASSDINLLVIFTELEIENLEKIAERSRKFLQEHRIAPRFLSKRNLDASAKYFQVDFLSMQDTHLVLWGKDVLPEIRLSPTHLRWQIAYEIKAIRMRLKQQYWRTADKPPLMRSVLLHRFTSLIHLMRALLRLQGLPAPATRRATLDAAIEHFDLDATFAEAMLRLHKNPTPPDHDTLRMLFGKLLDLIRIIDDQVESVKV